MHGYSESTKGLSVKFPSFNNKIITVLDSAGFETPIILNKEKKEETNKCTPKETTRK